MMMNLIVGTILAMVALVGAVVLIIRLVWFWKPE